MAIPLAVPIALAGISAISRFFGARNEEQERRRRLDRVLKGIEEDRQVQLAEAGRLINKALVSRIARSKQSATRQALAMGRMNEASSISAPIEGQATTAFADVLERTTYNINQNAASAKRAAQGDFANRPIEPSGFDLFGDLAEGASSIFANKMMLDAAFPQSTQTGSTGKYKPDIAAIMGGSGVKRKSKMNFSGVYR